MTNPQTPDDDVLTIRPRSPEKVRLDVLGRLRHAAEHLSSAPEFTDRIAAVVINDAVELIQQQAALIESLSAQAAGVSVQTQAALDVLAERQRQVEKEGWTPEHDDSHHPHGHLSLAAACYACNAATWLKQLFLGAAPPMDRYSTLSEPGMRWPWSSDWWKPKSPRRDLVKAGALILAEIERIDRATTKESTND